MNRLGGRIDAAAERRDDLCKAVSRIKAAIPRPGPRKRNDYHSLWPSEMEVLRLVALGLSNQEIAEALGVSVGTVRTHLKHLHDKCAIEGRSRLAVAAARAGV